MNELADARDRGGTLRAAAGPHRGGRVLQRDARSRGRAPAPAKRGTYRGWVRHAQRPLPSFPQRLGRQELKFAAQSAAGAWCGDEVTAIFHHCAGTSISLGFARLVQTSRLMNTALSELLLINCDLPLIHLS